MAQSGSAVPVFYPTLKECQGSWEEYVAKIEPSFREVGICKVVPPKDWKPSRTPRSEDQEILIKRPIEQRVTGRQGVFRALLLTRKEMSLQKEFSQLAAQVENQPPSGLTGEDLERAFWRSMHHHAPIYGADVEASFFDEDLKGWNMHKLDSLLTRVLEDRIPGVNTPYLYFGMWRSFFGWHTEDMELHSVNYLHYGAPKQWYCIPPAHRERFETWVKGLLPDCFRACSEFFRHKELLISPKRLKDACIPVVKLVQYPGEMVINFPGAYHSGFNCGFNCAESTNFATLSWIEFGAEADCCTCREDAVNIDMRRFIPYADEETREVIEHNFVSDSDSESEESCGASGCSEDHVPGVELIEDATDSDSEEDASSDYRAELSHRSKGRRASSIGTQQIKRKRIETCSPASPAQRSRSSSAAGQATPDSVSTPMRLQIPGGTASGGHTMIADGGQQTIQQPSRVPSQNEAHASEIPLKWRLRHAGMATRSTDAAEMLVGPDHSDWLDSANVASNLPKVGGRRSRRQSRQNATADDQPKSPAAASSTRAKCGKYQGNHKQKNA